MDALGQLGRLEVLTAVSCVRCKLKKSSKSWMRGKIRVSGISLKGDGNWEK